MKKIKKVYNVKLISITIGLILLYSTGAHAYFIEKNSLRVPIAIDRERQSEAVIEAFLSIRTTPQEDHKPLKILLIQSRLSTQMAKPTRLPVGLMSLASALRDKDFLANFFKKLGREEFILKDQGSYPDFMVEILDLQAESEGFDLESYLKRSNPDIVGFTAVTPVIDDAFKESLIVEKVLPLAIRIIGGPHVSALTRQTLEKTNFQIAVSGEGIETLTELVMEMRLDSPDLSRIHGTWYKDRKGEILENPVRVRKMKLEEYPFPALSVDLLNMNGYEELVDIEGVNQGQPAALFTSTGCPYGKCIFCASKAVFGRMVDFRSAESVFNEIKYLYDRGFRAFHVLDDLFTLDKQRILKLAELIENSGIKIQYSMMTRANFIDEKVAAALKKTGCKVAALGVESGDQDLLDSVIDKEIKLDSVVKATRIFKEVGINAKYFMIVGLPDQSWRSIRKSAYFILENDPDAMNVSIAIPYPGSSLYTDTRIRVVTNGGKYITWQHEAEPQLKQDQLIESVTETNVMSREEITEARDLLVFIFRNRRDTEKLRPLLQRLNEKATEAPSNHKPKIIVIPREALVTINSAI